MTASQESEKAAEEQFQKAQMALHDAEANEATRVKAGKGRAPSYENAAAHKMSSENAAAQAKAAEDALSYKHKEVVERDPMILRLEGPVGITLYDRDGSSELDAQEFRKLCKDLNPLEPAGVSDAEMDALMMQYDADENGQLSKEEVLDFAHKVPTMTPSTVPEAVCSGVGEEGEGASCQKWSFQTPWCYIDPDYQGPGAASKMASLDYPNKAFAPCTPTPPGSSMDETGNQVDATAPAFAKVDASGAAAPAGAAGVVAEAAKFTDEHAAAEKEAMLVVQNAASNAEAIHSAQAQRAANQNLKKAEGVVEAATQEMQKAEDTLLKDKMTPRTERYMAESDYR